MTLRELCANHTALSEADISILERAACTLELISDLIAGDVFIDCMGRDGIAIVVAEAKPRSTRSEYAGSVLGQQALIDNEPAVYHSLKEGVPMHDIKAVTQENITVSQDVTPILNEKGVTIGVLIGERNISRQVLLERKFEALSSEWPDSPADESLTGAIMQQIRETNHRIKNNLQMLSSINNMRMRRSQSPETKKRLLENTNMLLAVASLHEMLAQEEIVHTEQKISLPVLLRKLADGLSSLMDNQQRVEIRLECDEVFVSQQRAIPIALVVNELLTNSLEHAFPDGSGNIRIVLQKGNLLSSIVVHDDGAGFREDARRGLGLKMASMTVRDRLKGELIIRSEHGTKATFSFMT
ncbi:MAG: putative sensor histidine kinase pdtaS [Firmicutes bacterium ADurb.Bin182]|nr:MAG: putative sensor histidine kinase pdtaS [Firmicutes bacterium ADurb.Bin182]